MNANRKELTPEEKALEAQIAEHVRKSNAFSKGESHTCPQCGAEVESATLYEKMEPDMFSLYVHPCNCRLGLWSAAPKWITNVKIVPLEMPDFSDDDDDFGDYE